MKKNDIVTLKVTALTSEGSGVSRLDGMVIFTPFTAVGDVIEARIVKCLKSYCYAKTERIITPSPDRVESGCAVFGKCGGCTFRHISYEAELRAKQDIVKSAFERIGGLTPDFLPIAGSESTEHYRNKLQMPLAKSEDGAVCCGFFSERSHRVIAVSDCVLQPKVFSEISAFICERIQTLKISVYNEEKHEGVVRHIFLRKGHYSGEICAVIVARRKVPEFARLAAELREKFPEIVGVVLNINPDKTNVILGECEIVLSGCAEISDSMCGVSVELSPKSFYQVNTPAAENLYRQAAQFAQPQGKIIVDLYCGAGTIGLSMSSEAKQIIGAEIVPEAVENARKNAERCGISNAEFICADAGEAAKELNSRGLRPDVIMLDPPRKGCGEECLKACVEMNPERIVMISCNPATAAKDCRFLSENGYSVDTVRAFDLFPRTKHCECVVLMTKK